MINELVVGALTLLQKSDGLTAEQIQAAKGKSLASFVMADIDGKETPLKKFADRAVLIVNVASNCGLTKQYEGLQKLYSTYKDKGFVILGFPANEFRGQEPGSNQQIKEFCTETYGVTFPMFSKIVVKGDGIHPLYQWLLASTDPQKDIEWNFAKFLVFPGGKKVMRFPPQTKPDAQDLKMSVELALGDVGRQ